MPSRLSELLDRIRPVGTPGAATEGAEQRQVDARAGEIAAIAEVLAAFQAEADAILEAARTQASRIRETARQEACAIEDRIPDQVASAGVETAAAHRDRAESQRRIIVEQAEAEARRLRQQADALIPELVSTATTLIWTSVAPEASSGQH